MIKEDIKVSRSECLFLRRWYKRFGCTTPLIEGGERFASIVEECYARRQSFDLMNLRFQVVQAFINSTAEIRPIRATIEKKQQKQKKIDVKDFLDRLAKFPEAQSAP